jgi:NAD(P)-dependent dehydrogenase (short-subunit alcohol dehydrogenase family)
MENFKGKTAVITGAGSGIGRGMAIAFARVGMQVVVSDIERAAAEKVVAEIVAAGGKAVSIVTDVASLDSVRSLAAFADKSFGPVHVLCNNAGVSVGTRGIDATHEDWTWVMGVNLWGVIHGIEAFLPAMRARKDECHIVNTASMNGIFPSARSALYSTTKYGLLGLSETLANELAGSNIGISILCPAAVATRIFESERNRPAALVPTRTAEVPAVPAPSSVFDISPPIDPVVVGEMVLNGMRRRQLHIFTDMKVKPIIEARHQRMMSEFDRLAEFEVAAKK